MNDSETMSEQIVNIALIGQKFMGRAHSNAWSQAPKFFDLPLTPALHTIAARDGSTLAGFAARWGWRRHTTDWRELAADDELHLVDIATPNDLHAEQSIAMLEAGRHVACEKPLARSLDEARQMRDAAESCQRSAIGSQQAGADDKPIADSRQPTAPRTFVWFNYRRCPAAAFAHQLIKEGTLGRIYHVRARYLQSWGGPETPMLWRFDKSRAGSGAHGDLNAHIVDLARFMTGEEIAEVHGAVARTFITERTHFASGKPPGATSDVDDVTLFLATFTGGAVASFEASRLATGRLNDNTIEINAERGALRFSFEDMNVLWYYDAADKPRTDGWRRIMCTNAESHPYVKNWWPDAHLLGYEHGFVNMAADIMRALAGEEPEVPLPDFADAYETQRVLEAALLAAENRCAIMLDEVK
jgi:predicted dehydrogenase